MCTMMCIHLKSNGFVQLFKQQTYNSKVENIILIKLVNDKKNKKYFKNIKLNQRLNDLSLD